jgi:hypothetical protein
VALFEKPETFTLIDYNKSTLKQEAFVTYISNMKMNCDLVNYTDIPKEDKKILLKLFIDSRYPVMLLALRKALASVLIYHRTGKLIFDFLTESEIKEFINENKDKLNTYSSFFDSMLISIPIFSTAYREIFDQEILEEKILVIDDAEIIPINVYGLIEIPDFIDFFVGSNPEESKPTYYKHQIENFIYNKKTFFQIIMGLESNSFILSLFNMLTSTEEEETNFFKNLKKDEK